MSSLDSIAVQAIGASIRHAPRPMILVGHDFGILSASKSAQQLASSSSMQTALNAVQDRLASTLQSSTPVVIRLALQGGTKPFVGWRINPVEGHRQPMIMLRATSTLDAVTRLARVETESSHALNRLSAVQAEHHALRQEARRLRQLAEQDRLTGLLNAAAFADRCQHRLRADRDGVMYFIDLDRFKAINDGFGHDAGDHILKLVATSLREELRQNDLIARLGGDEFGIWVEDIQSSQAAHLARRFEAEISTSTCFARADGKACILSVGASVGWVSSDGCRDYQQLLSQADTAMYAQKNVETDRLTL